MTITNVISLSILKINHAEGCQLYTIDILNITNCAKQDSLILSLTTSTNMSVTVYSYRTIWNSVLQRYTVGHI